MKASDVVRIRGYLVEPFTRPLLRFSGQDPLETRSLELVRITLNDGSEGVAGAATGWLGSARGCLLRELESLGNELIGRDVRHRGVITTELLARPCEGLPQAISLLDVAMWDAFGRHVNSPVWQLLGGYRETIPAYASTLAFLTIAEYIQVAGECIDAGYRAIKFHMNGEPNFDLEIIRAVERAYPDSGLRFMVDLEQRYQFDDAVRLGRVLSSLPYDWMEAPLPDTDLEAYVELVHAVGVDVLAAGNTLVGLPAWQMALRRGAWSRLRCDANNAGGITMLCKAMALAESHGMLTEIQSYGFCTTQFSDLHVSLGLPGCSWFEQPFPPHDFDYGTRSPLRIDKQGCVRAPDGAGLGIEMDWLRIERDAGITFDLS